ncbi:MAG: TetR/AcrR family transcriptional regulator [Clostridiales bacterium]|nr:TetR/AcrR family transcriptional regulator [Clostridiales bacterium]
MNKSTNPSAVRSKKEITEALLKLMKKYPYNEISVKQIVLETDLVRKTFYRNFSSKDDVLNSYIDIKAGEYVEALMDRTDPLTVIFEYCDRNRELLELLEKNGLMHLLLIRLNEILPEVSRTTDRERNPFSKLIGDLDPDYIVAFNVGAIWNIATLWVKRGMKDSPETIRNTIEQYLKNLSQPFRQ